jgi:ATP-binding cassette, subfamily B (MDR/TAP), member 1
MTIVMSIGSIAAPISAAAQAAGAASILFSIIDAPSPGTEGVMAPEISALGDVVLESVDFAYPIRPDVKVLENLSVRFPAGKLTAIVGASGSGKSTIVGLIERWYELDGNTIDNLTVSLSAFIKHPRALLTKVIDTSVSYWYNYCWWSKSTRSRS